MTNNRNGITPGNVDRFLAMVGETPVHLTDEEFADYTAETLPSKEMARVDAHLATCRECSSEVEFLRRESAVWRTPEGEGRLRRLKESLLDQARKTSEHRMGFRDVKQGVQNEKPAALAAPIRRTMAPGDGELLADCFLSLAAADKTGGQAITVRSQRGIWTLEVFVGKSERDQKLQRGYLLLTVDPEHRSTYEGRSARVFVNVGNEERDLAQAIVRDGEIYAPISLAGLDLRARDAINIVFGAQEVAGGI